MFKDSSNVFAGWIHYLAFDALVGRWIVMDSTKRGASTQFHFAVVVPCLFFTLVSGCMAVSL